MTRNAIESDFQSSKMPAGGHFVKKKVVYWCKWREMAIKSDFRSSKMAAGSHFVKKKSKKVEYLSKMVRNAIDPKWPVSAILQKK